MKKSKQKKKNETRITKKKSAKEIFRRVMEFGKIKKKKRAESSDRWR